MANTKIGLDENVRNRFFENYGEEEVYWSGRYRHSTKAHWYIIALLLILSIGYLGWKVRVWFLWLLIIPMTMVIVSLLKLHTHTFEINNKRLEIHECNLLCKHFLHYIEYYEIKSVKVELYSKDRGHFIFETKSMELPIVRSPRIDKISKIHKMVKEMMERSRSFMEHQAKQGHLRD